MFDLPFDTCCTFLVFGPPLSKRYKTQILIQLHKIAPQHLLQFIPVCHVCIWLYLILLSARGQAFDLGSQLNKHVSYGGDPRVEVFVFIVLCTEVFLVPLTLLQTHDGAVCAARRHYRVNDDVRLANIADGIHAGQSNWSHATEAISTNPSFRFFLVQYLFLTQDSSIRPHCHAATLQRYPR